LGLLHSRKGPAGKGVALLIHKILLPVDFPIASVSVIQQAVTLAERFQAEIVMLHVATPKSHAAGVPTQARDLENWNLLAQIVRGAEQEFDEALRKRLEALSVRGVVREGEPAPVILGAAQTENAGLIMMASHGYLFDQFLLGSVTAKVVRWRERPVWTAAHVETPSAKAFSIHNILCAVNLGPRSQEAASWAAQLAADFNAHLTLSTVTESMAIMAPGGAWTNPEYQQALINDASRRVTELKKNLRIKADLLIGSGDVPKVLAQIADKTEADLLVLDCYPYSGNLRIHGYAVICSVSIPVLSV
jgi:nucleotide-binding universal stress UspA family protein